MYKTFFQFTKIQKIFLYNIDSKFNFDNIKESKEKVMKIRENIWKKETKNFYKWKIIKLKYAEN